MTINELTIFLGWCTIMNVSILLLTSLMVFFFKNCVVNIHSKLAGIDTKELPTLYFHYLGNYKIGIVLFNLVPYFSLKLM
jgi:hypothetical protein